ncbi:MAG: hypothetical protein J0J01_31325 [Reyranella sp.]|uniref:hypothetical protein n=1 Tax=Reyranella sp. TaxID=1929291 RepID=UPI001AC1A33D|nr:hypothetical protein [Reyranella sp.]MBN9091433.1 hypothetical protein [Reyranella sp.]
MPIYVEISRLYRCATVVARGKITREEILATADELIDADIPLFAKLIDVAGATSDVTAGDVRRLAAVLRKVGKIKRGPVAFLIAPERADFARAFAATQTERPVRLFTSIHQARDWLTRDAHIEAEQAPPPAANGVTPWSDPQREAVLIRRRQRRALAMPASRPAYGT